MRWLQRILGLHNASIEVPAVEKSLFQDAVREIMSVNTTLEANMTALEKGLGIESNGIRWDERENPASDLRALCAQAESRPELQELAQTTRALMDKQIQDFKDILDARRLMAGETLSR